VYVTNISAKATPDILVDFFSYCGVVNSVELYKDNTDTSQFAAIYFEEREAVRTALLLSGGYIYDQPIDIQLLSGDLESQLKKKKKVGSTLSKSESKSTSTTGTQSKSSVVASMMSAGYNLGSDVISKAKNYDEKHFAGKVANTLSSAKDKISSINDKYEISKKAQKGKDALVSTVQSFFSSKKEQPVVNHTEATTNSTNNPPTNHTET